MASKVSATGYSVRLNCFFECLLALQQEEVQGHVTMPALPAAALVVTQTQQLLSRKMEAVLAY